MKVSILDLVERKLLRLIMKLPSETLLRVLGQRQIKVKEHVLHAEIQLYLLVRKLKRRPGMGDLPPQLSRLAYVKDSLVHGIEVPDVSSEDLDIPRGETEKISARLYRSSSSKEVPLIVYFHGGGFVIGDIEMFDHVCRYISKKTGFHVVAINYRKAPECPFPGAIEESVDAYQWIRENASKIGVDNSKIIVAGDSAGANIATVVAQELLRRKESTPIYQLLFYPVCDMKNDYPSRSLFGEKFFLTLKDFEYFHGHYLGDQAKVKVEDYRISPLHGELTGMPPAIIATAEFDPLRDEGEAYAEALQRSGTEVRVVRVKGMIHGFINLIGFSPFSKLCVDSILETLRNEIERRS